MVASITGWEIQRKETEQSALIYLPNGSKTGSDYQD
jgi:hypothetical protein